jgi:hypothetical protein
MPTDVPGRSTEMSQRGLRRRDVFALGTAALAAPWLSRLAFAEELLATPQGAAAATPISIGYLDGSADLSNLARLDPALRRFTVVRNGNALVEQRQVVPAVGLPSGDPSLVGRPVRIGIRGLYGPAPGRLKNIASVNVDIYVPSLELPAGDGALFHAWTLQRLPATNTSAPLTFPIWPDWVSNFAVTLTVVNVTGKAQTFHSAFTLAAKAKQPRLQPGAYLLGLTAATWSSPVELPEPDAPVPAALASVVLTVSPEGVGAARG